MLKDPDMADLAKEELESLEEEKVKLEEKLEILLIPKDPNDSKNVIMEIRGAAGGDEANIFAGDLFRMYSRYAEKQGYKIELEDLLVLNLLLKVKELILNSNMKMVHTVYKEYLLLNLMVEFKHLQLQY